MIIMVNCIVNEQVSNLAMIIIQTVNNININSYVCKKYGNNLSIKTRSVWANIIDPAQSDQGLLYLQFTLGTPHTVKQSFSNFGIIFVTIHSVLFFSDFMMYNNWTGVFYTFM